jgi:hypothetical protein
MSVKKLVIDITASVITSPPYTKPSSAIVDKILVESEKITETAKMCRGDRERVA